MCPALSRKAGRIMHICSVWLAGGSFQTPKKPEGREEVKRVKLARNVAVTMRIGPEERDILRFNAGGVA